MVVPKPGKAPKVKETAGGWRPISLISMIGKVMEKDMCVWLTEAAELYNILPES